MMPCCIPCATTAPPATCPRRFGIWKAPTDGCWPSMRRNTRWRRRQPTVRLLLSLFESVYRVMHWFRFQWPEENNGSADRPCREYLLIARAPHATRMPHIFMPARSPWKNCRYRCGAGLTQRECRPGNMHKCRPGRCLHAYAHCD